jgi:hypothetical protein
MRHRPHLSDVRRRERANPDFHIRLTWPSMFALLLTCALGGALVWLGVTFLPPANITARGDYRILGGVAAIAAYPWLHGRFRRLTGG